MKLTLGAFGGAIKALHPKLLTGASGADSLNQKPGRGDLRPWRQPLAVATVPAGRATIYRFGRDVKSDANYWFSWTTRVHVVRGYNTQDTSERTYFTGNGAPQWTDNTIALASAPYPVAARHLGVPAPASAVTLVASGGTSANTESRYYTYTYVTNIGEESAPAPVSLELVCKTDDHVTIGGIAAAPSGNFTIDRVRIYVTQSGQNGETEFFFLREVAAGTASTTDDLRARGDVLETAGWLEPPADLHCLTAMWDGMIAGISGTGFRFCVPYAPYAWKIDYEILPPDTFPVGLGSWRQNLLGLTTGKPLLMTGSSPDSLDQQPVPAPACSSEPSIVSFDHGVAWASEDGLAYYGDAGAKMVTAGLLTRDDWQAMNPSTMVASQYEGAYLCFYTDGGGVRRGFLIDPISPQGIFFLDFGYAAVFFDQLQDALYVLDGVNVRKWDAGATPLTATFRSKEFVTGMTNFAWARVVADSYPVTLKVDAGPFTPAQLTALIATNTSVLSAAADKLRMTLTVAGEDPVRLPGGFRANEWQVQVETANPVQGVALATTAKETA